ncbi:branched-chain amino acid ABC transporter permease [Rhodoferax sediminis]|uniref:Branched-chain amino acid ABC transporter permease n=1 Tax=Rhodoferax sediminis TaxID=2509614 RepID=A0A515DA00_9BURK|nr:branched-chain amino acid ABC transporter permease [Rhodoferax sediminis]QDL37238.1 branched-chain amino acid ABC transporter permease [Rhodoferax sediminis]
MLSQQIINALSQGAFYALFAAGLTLIFGVLDILNMAHGAVFMWGAMLSWYLMSALGVNFGFALLITIVFCGLMGLLLEHAAFRPLRGRSSGHLPPLVSSLALSIVLVHVAEKIFGTRVVRYPDDAVPFAQSVEVGGVQVSLLHVVLLVVALVLMGALWYMVARTRLGRSIRALQENPKVARLMGVDVDRTIAWMFVIASVLAGIAGAFLGVAYNSASPYMGNWVDLKGFAVIILGGMGSIPGALLGGMLIGFAEIGTVVYLSSDYRDAAVFVVLMGMLLLKPSGLLGSSREVRA